MTTHNPWCWCWFRCCSPFARRICVFFDSSYTISCPTNSQPNAQNCLFGKSVSSYDKSKQMYIDVEGNRVKGVGVCRGVRVAIDPNGRCNARTVFYNSFGATSGFRKRGVSAQR